jgi:hypothetical protein
MLNVQAGMPISQYLADANLNWIRGTSFPAALSGNAFISLHGADPGYNGVNADVTTTLIPGGRVACPISVFTAPVDGPGATSRRMSNTTLVSLTESAAGPASVTYFGLWSAQTGGNFLVYGLVNPPANFLAGDIVRFPAGGLVISGL